MSVSGKARGQVDEQVQLDLLSRQIGRYNLVVAVAKRARDLKERIDSVLVPSSGSLIDRALREVAEKKVKILSGGEEKAEEEESEE